jgi:hypothetical protein
MEFQVVPVWIHPSVAIRLLAHPLPFIPAEIMPNAIKPAQGGAPYRHP